ncbi:hypothetical protein RHMOL_Rhmol09G0251700 [Rhododendron molle]|uniref:Uncharacterized protein n=1 Tax=Rhododendron molle TaxID=49168 RepID=A0ACC0MGY3_RHOML|nr:hypothetical protein RHMOL_Rhmol09G0251700 [Rhododendron molle]
MTTKLSQSHGLSPREVAIMRDCCEELSNLVDQLRRSMGEMSQLKGSIFDLMMSAAMTNEDTCTEGLFRKQYRGQQQSEEHREGTDCEYRAFD